MILGAVFAGGQARRFGADKAAVEIDGVPMIERVARALRPYCDAVVVVGRDWPGLARVEDSPGPGLGPLGALAGALAYAREHAFEAVLTAGCDLPDLPADLFGRLYPGPAVIAGQPLLGLWPTGGAAGLVQHLESGERAMRGWIQAQRVREVDAGRTIANINTPEDLVRYEASRRRLGEAGTFTWADPRSSP